MRRRVPKSINLCHRFAAAGSAALLVSCAHAPQRTTANSATTPSAGSFYGLASSSARSASVFETHTLSLALDRIDQRTLPLDQTYRHVASGKGVTVYVFDGGVSPYHPELAGRVRAGFSGFPTTPRSATRTAQQSPAQSQVPRSASRLKQRSSM